MSLHVLRQKFRLATNDTHNATHFVCRDETHVSSSRLGLIRREDATTTCSRYVGYASCRPSLQAGSAHRSHGDNVDESHAGEMCKPYLHSHGILLKRVESVSGIDQSLVDSLQQLE